MNSYRENHEKKPYAQTKEKEPRYSVSQIKFSFIQSVTYKNKSYLIGINKEDSKVYFWDTGTAEWQLMIM